MTLGFYPLVTFSPIFMNTYPSDQSVNILPNLPDSFQIFCKTSKKNADVSIALYPLSQLFYFYYIMLYPVYLLLRKEEVQPSFNL